MLYICTYNVRSLATTERMIELRHALERVKYDIIGIAEVRREGYVIEEDDENIFCYYGQRRGYSGTGFLIKKKYKSYIHSFVGLTERVSILNLKFNQQGLSLIQVHVPTTDSSLEEIEAFYSTLDQALLQAEKDIILIGDLTLKLEFPNQAKT